MKTTIIIICLLLLSGCQSLNTPLGLTAKVQKVISGQTLDVLAKSKQSTLIERIRLIGITAPDLQQHPWGIAAKERLEELLSETNSQQLVLQSVLLESQSEKKDAFGRRLAYVWRNGVLINEQLVSEGYVLAEILDPNFKYQQRLIHAQEYARLMGYGIWNPQNPMHLTPKEFRSQNKI